MPQNPHVARAETIPRTGDAARRAAGREEAGHRPTKEKGVQAAEAFTCSGTGGGNFVETRLDDI